MTVLEGQSGEAAEAAVLFFLNLYEVDIEEAEDEPAYPDLLRYAKKGHLYVADGGAQVCWDPEGQLGENGVMFREGTGRDLALIYDQKGGRKGEAKDAGMHRMIAALTSTTEAKLRRLTPRHARMVNRFATFLV